MTKKSILRIPNVYTAHAFFSESRFYIGAGSETDPVVLLHDLAASRTESLDGCPGGMMSFIPVPGRSDTFVSIMGLFPPFIGKEAGLFLHTKEGGGWTTFRGMDLPFAHRCEFLPGDLGRVLVAATVSSHKKDPSDWSQPGELCAIRFDETGSGRWEPEKINASITRNHGMGKFRIDGEERLLVSGAEGIFTLSLSSRGKWEITQLFEREVSEMTLIDVDGDGQPELVTIEPFHGDSLNLYKREGGKWNLKFSGPLSFGHGLSSGAYRGVPVIVAGNRSDSMALEIFTVNNLKKGSVQRKVIEPDAGPTQTQVFHFQGEDYILSANQRKHEVALYHGPLTE